MSGDATDDKRDQINFVSVDSAPKKFAGMISVWRAPATLGVFVFSATALLLAVNSSIGQQYFPNRDLVFSPYDGNHAIAIRIFLISFFIAFGAFSSGNAIARARFAADMVATSLFICALLDLAILVLCEKLGAAYSLHFSAITSGLLGFAVFSFKLLQRGFMPARIRVEHRPVKMTRAILRLLVTIGIAGFTSIWVGGMELEIVSKLRSWTLLGGIGPGVFLFLPVLFEQLYLFAIWDVITTKVPDFRHPISIIVPAHNEQYVIENTIRAIDEAAAHYQGDVHILIMNNNSTDDTDLSLRIGALGFHSVVNPKLRYVSEVPVSYWHMREQRMRWFRSVYHISSRCRDLIYSKNSSLRGKIILPYILENSGHRAMLVPLIIFGGLECAFSFNPNSPIVWQSVVAVATGAPSIVAVAASLLKGVPRGLIALPEYLIFRVIRAYFTLESMQSILVDIAAENLERATAQDI